MRSYLMKKPTLIPLYISLLLVLFWALFFYSGSWSQLWSTADQQGYKSYQEKEYAEAAKSFEDPLFKAASYFKEGEFKRLKHFI